MTETTHDEPAAETPDEIVYDETPRLMLKLDELQSAAVALAQQRSGALNAEAEQLENRAKALRSDAQNTLLGIVVKVFDQHGETFPKDTNIRIENNERGMPGVLLWEGQAPEEAAEKAPPAAPQKNGTARGAVAAPPLPVKRERKVPTR